MGMVALRFQVIYVICVKVIPANKLNYILGVALHPFIIFFHVKNFINTLHLAMNNHKPLILSNMRSVNEVNYEYCQGYTKSVGDDVFFIYHKVFFFDNDIFFCFGLDHPENYLKITAQVLNRMKN